LDEKKSVRSEYRPFAELFALLSEPTPMRGLLGVVMAVWEFGGEVVVVRSGGP
jgi:hypothetical protein